MMGAMMGAMIGVMATEMKKGVTAIETSTGKIENEIKTEMTAAETRTGKETRTEINKMPQMISESRTSLPGSSKSIERGQMSYAAITIERSKRFVKTTSVK